MSDDKIIDINSLRKLLNNEEDSFDKIPDRVLFTLLETMGQKGYDIQDDEFCKDMNIVMLLLEAAIHRLEGTEDENIQILDNCINR